MIDNKAMELITALAVLILAIPATAQAFIFYKLYQDAVNKDVSDEPKTGKVPPEPQDVYNPYYTEGTVPLDEFVPKSGEKIKIVREEPDNITPLNGN